jgi:hypothetical protein
MLQTIETPAIDLEDLCQAIRDEYALAANEPCRLGNSACHSTAPSLPPHGEG